MNELKIKNDWDNKAWCELTREWVDATMPDTQYPPNLASRIVAAHPEKEHLRLEG